MENIKLEAILNALENISLAEWKKIKTCIDREFESQSNKLTFRKREEFRTDVETEFIQ
ncbi:hypothetical protein [Clostridium algidicarnis]|uniref:hypothetical protein n=1 Tax=Clostridium algidicarnis TaxID=37659 RepID=UPI001C0AD8A7|nr:hypothetical protein [Clostridium algidicarnis]MBU3205184.1 hypothetical protein [Clostridium algidicarnis]MBU3213337.1 hypothetical protein [Clostridium algidicarnis]MBU3223768.1 hypothetical protein [Clostridium algidicarnis]